MGRDCEHCGKPLKLASTGRPKRFCGQRCRKASNRSLGVPRSLLSQPRWVRHYRKRPLTVEGRAASVTDPRSWSTFPDVRTSRAGHGIGFVLGDGIGCLDFDNVINDDGQLDPRVQTLLESLPATWIEVSPSGKGLHVWGLLPERAGKVIYRGGVRIERYSAGRYITVTGRRWENSPLVLGDLSAAMSW